MEQLQRLVRLTSPVCVVSSCYLNPNTHRSRIGLRIATIAGSVIGGVAFLIILSLSITVFCRSRWRRHERPPSNWTIDHVPSMSHRHSHHNNPVSESMTANRASRQFTSSDGQIIPNTTPVLDQPSADTSDKPALDVLRHDRVAQSTHRWLLQTRQETPSRARHRRLTLMIIRVSHCRRLGYLHESCWVERHPTYAGNLLHCKPKSKVLERYQLVVTGGMTHLRRMHGSTMDSDDSGVGCPFVKRRL